MLPISGESPVNDFNKRLALYITNHIGTMYCAYVFAVIGIAGVVFAFTGNTTGVLIVGAISGYFLQLVLLPIIMVGQGLQGEHTRTHLEKHLAIHHDKLKELLQGEKP